MIVLHTVHVPGVNLPRYFQHIDTTLGLVILRKAIDVKHKISHIRSARLSATVTRDRSLCPSPYSEISRYSRREASGTGRAATRTIDCFRTAATRGRPRECRATEVKFLNLTNRMRRRVGQGYRCHDRGAAGGTGARHARTRTGGQIHAHRGQTQDPIIKYTRISSLVAIGERGQTRGAANIVTICTLAETTRDDLPRAFSPSPSLSSSRYGNNGRKQTRIAPFRLPSRTHGAILCGLSSSASSFFLSATATPEYTCLCHFECRECNAVRLEKMNR